MRYQKHITGILSANSSAIRAYGSAILMSWNIYGGCGLVEAHLLLIVRFFIDAEAAQTHPIKPC